MFEEMLYVDVSDGSDFVARFGVEQRVEKSKGLVGRAMERVQGNVRLV